MNLKKIGKVFTSKFVGTGPSSYEKRIYRATVSQRLRNTGIVTKGIDNVRGMQHAQPVNKMEHMITDDTVDGKNMICRKQRLHAPFIFSCVMFLLTVIKTHNECVSGHYQRLLLLVNCTGNFLNNKRHSYFCIL
jgi:hypothetical protein